MRVAFRNILVAIAIVCGVVVTAVAASASVGGAKHQAKAAGVKTYVTGGTIPLGTAVFDPFLFSYPSDPQGGQALAMTRSAGATYLRIVASWQDLAPAARPSNFVATDPTSPGYRWGWLDNIVAAAEAARLTPILNIASAPSWALATRPKGRNAGSPKSAALGEFARALAVHYDGLNGALAVHRFEVWNEPNLSLQLAPVSPAHYRSMVNAVAVAVHAVSRANLVVAGGLDPFGNKTKKWHAVSPLTYMRELLCVSMGNPKAKTAALRHPHATCKQPIDFDVWSHHPYSFKGPFGHATRANDVSLGDLPKMRAVLSAALKVHRVVSSHHVQFWVTEFSWDTQPPRRHAAPVGLASRWTAEALYQMWRSGVSLVTWFGLVDLGGKGPYQSGLFFHGTSLARAKPKPVRTAFRFPFVAYLGRGDVSVWGRDATSNKQLVTIQRRTGTHGTWRTVAKVRSNASGIFSAKLKLAASEKDWIRATAAGSGNSLGFSLTRPSLKLRYGPWGN